MAPASADYYVPPGTSEGTPLENSTDVISAYQGYYYEHVPPAVAKTEVNYKDTVFTAWESEDGKVYGSVLLGGTPAKYGSSTYFELTSGMMPALASVVTSGEYWVTLMAYVVPSKNGSTEGYGTLYVAPVTLDIDTSDGVVKSYKVGTPVQVASYAACPWLVSLGNGKYALVYEAWDDTNGVCSLDMVELTVSVDTSTSPPTVQITVGQPVTLVSELTNGLDAYVQGYASKYVSFTFQNGTGTVSLNFSSLSSPPTSVTVGVFTPWDSKEQASFSVSLSSGQGSFQASVAPSGGEFKYTFTVGTDTYTVTTDGPVQLCLEVASATYDSTNKSLGALTANAVATALGVQVSPQSTTSGTEYTVKAPSSGAYLYLVIPTSNGTEVVKGVGQLTFTVSGAQVTVGSSTYTASGNLEVYLACADLIPEVGPGRYVSSSMGRTVNAYLHPRPVATVFTFESNGQTLDALLVAYTDYSEAFPSTMWGDWYGDFMNARAKVLIYDLSSGEVLDTLTLPGDTMYLYDFPVTCCAYPFVSGDLVAWMYGSLWGSMTGNVPDVYVAAIQGEYSTSSQAWQFQLVGSQPAPSELYTQTNPYVRMIGEDNGTYYYVVEYSDNSGGFGYVDVSCATVAVSVDATTGAVNSVRVMYTGPVTKCEQGRYQYCPAFVVFPDHGTMYSVYYVGDTGYQGHKSGDVYSMSSRITTSLGLVAQIPAVEVEEELSSTESNLTQQVTTLQQEMQSLQNDVNDLKQTVSQVENDVNELKSNVSDLQNKVNELESRGAGVDPLALLLGLAALVPLVRRR